LTLLLELWHLLFCPKKAIKAADSLVKLTHQTTDAGIKLCSKLNELQDNQHG